MEIKLKICMLLPFPRYSNNLRVPPQVGIISYLVHFGHNVKWILWSDSELKVQPIILNGVQISAITDHQFFPTKYFLFKIFNRMPNSMIRMRLTLKAFNQGSCNLIIVRDDALDGLIGYYIKRKYKVPFVFVLSNPLEQGLEYTKIVEGNINIIKNTFFRLHTFLTYRLLHRADLIMPISKWLGEDLVAKGFPITKIMPVPEGINPEVFQNHNGKDVTEKYNLEDSNVIIYIGTLGKGRRMELLIRAFSEVRKHRDQVKLLIVGEGDGKEDLERSCYELGVDEDVIFTGQVPMSKVPSYIAASDIGVSPVPPFSFYKMSSPIKMFEYMAMGKPVVANEEIPEHKEVLEESRGGILVPNTPEGFSDAIIQLLDDREKALQMGRNGQDWVLKHRTYEKMAKDVVIGLLQIFDIPGINSSLR